LGGDDNLSDGDNGSSGAGNHHDAPSRHILPTSATMAGVCMTMVGLVKIIEGTAGPSHIDQAFAVVGLVFLASAFVSYLSIRARGSRDWLESIADGVFMVGLVLMVLAGGAFAFELA